MNRRLNRWCGSAIRRSDRGAVAIEAAAIMGLIGVTVLVAVPELVYQSRAGSLTARATALTVDLIGAQTEKLTNDVLSKAQSMAQWAIEPLDPAKLAFRAQSFVRDNQGVITEEWSRTMGSACQPDTATVTQAEPLISVDGRSMISVSSCYKLQSLTGFVADRTISSQFWQAARRGRIAP